MRIIKQGNNPEDKLFTGPFADLHEYIEKLMGRPVFTHELANEKLVSEIKEKARPDFMNLVSY